MEKVTSVPKLAVRVSGAHKGDFGKVLIVAGSIGMSGAAAIAGRSALRAGAGLVRVAVPKSILPIVAATEPCYTTAALDEDDGAIASAAAARVIELAKANDVTAFGPGIDTGKGARDVLSELIAVDNLRLVIDADGLNCLAKLTAWVKRSVLSAAERKKASIILTPHPGEMKRLWASLFREPIPPDRIEQAVAMARKTACTVVLKGAGTVVTDGDKFYVNTTGNPGMATAGAGDVLTGVIAALAGQGMNDFDAAVAGVYIHGLAGDLAAGKKGQVSLTATDIIEFLPDAFMQY